MELLLQRARHLGVVRSEFAFRALPEYEVLSPSNTKAEMREKATLCLATGTEEFWIVDPKTVTVLRRGAEARLYTVEDQIPLTLFGGTLNVSQIFD